MEKGFSWPLFCSNDDIKFVIVGLQQGLITVVDDEKQDDGQKVGYNVEEVHDGRKSAKKLPQFLRQGSAIPRQIHHKENRTLTMECH